MIGRCRCDSSRADTRGSMAPRVLGQAGEHLLVVATGDLHELGVKVAQVGQAIIEGGRPQQLLLLSVGGRRGIGWEGATGRRRSDPSSAAAAEGPEGERRETVIGRGGRSCGTGAAADNPHGWERPGTVAVTKAGGRAAAAPC